MSQISDPQASIESSAVTAQGQTVLSQSESESAITYPVSAAAADLSQVCDKNTHLNSTRGQGSASYVTVMGESQ